MRPVDTLHQKSPGDLNGVSWSTGDGWTMGPDLGWDGLPVPPPHASASAGPVLIGDIPPDILSSAKAPHQATAGGTTTTPSSSLPADPASPTPFTIDINWDSSVSSAPAGFTSDVLAAVQYLETQFVNPVTITIDVGYNEIDGSGLSSGDIGESMTYMSSVSYSRLAGAVTAHATTATDASVVAFLPATSPVSGANYWVTAAQSKALGLTASNTSLDGYVGFGASSEFTYGDTATSGTVAPGTYDFFGTVVHEITEVMGRQMLTGKTLGSDPNSYDLLDLLHYSAPGTHDFSASTAGYFSADGGVINQGQFNTVSGGDPGDWASSVTNDSFDAYANSGVINAVTANDLTEMNVLGYSLAPACYAAGTRILTAQGEVRVEDLAVGDVVRARFAGLTAITWIGHRRIDCRRHPSPQQVWPVRVVAGAFGADQPCRDLLLSPDHAVAVNGALIPIRLLVNGASIRQDVWASEVHYFHIELDRHDLLLADGLDAESYLDTGNRGMFANAGGPIVLYPTLEEPTAQQRREAGSCLKLLGDPLDVEPVWQALAARAESLGLALPVVATTPDPDLCIVAGARRFAPVLHDGGRYTFALPPLPDGARLRSRCAVPSAVRPWLEDRRRLGVMVRRIALRRGTDVVEVAPDDPRLADGWWAAERDADAPWRWTDGDAELPPIDEFSSLEVLIGETPAYPLAELADGCRTDAGRASGGGRAL